MEPSGTSKNHLSKPVDERIFISQRSLKNIFESWSFIHVLKRCAKYTWRKIDIIQIVFYSPMTFHSLQ